MNRKRKTIVTRTISCFLILLALFSLSACGGGTSGEGATENNIPADTNNSGNTGSSGSVPAAPAGVTVASGDGQVTVNWDSVPGATSYNLYMATQSGLTKNNYSSLPGQMKHASVTAPYTHTGITNGTTYYFVVTSVNDNGESAESSEVAATSATQISSLPPGSMTTARSMHTATLLPDGKVLIAGGDAGADGFIVSAELYDPSTGSYTNAGNMTEFRANHATTLLSNGKVLITGGLDPQIYPKQFNPSMELYDPTTQTFTNIGNMETFRISHTATLLPNGKILIAGGLDYNRKVIASTELYDPATDTFASTSKMAPARYGHTATLLSNGKVLIAGGGASAELYDPATGIFTSTGSMTTERIWHTATLLPNGKVLIAGGWDYGGQKTSSSAELYDPTTGTFAAISDTLTTARQDHAATALLNGNVLILGGSNDTSGPFSSAELYNSETQTFSAIESKVSVKITPESATVGRGGNQTFSATITGSTNTGVTWSVQEGASGGTINWVVQDNRVNFEKGVYTAPTTPGTYHIIATSRSDPNKSAMVTVTVISTLTARISHTATLLSNGKVLIAGGLNSNYESVSSAELYDSTTSAFKDTGSMNTAHSNGFTATLLSDGKVLIAGGVAGSSGYFFPEELYNPSTGTFTYTGDMVPRNEHSATVLPNGKVLIAGGWSAVDSSFDARADLYDPVTGTFTATGSMTAERTNGFTTTMLPNGKVLFTGGADGSGRYLFLESAELYDPIVGTFTAIGNMKAALGFRHSATLLPSGKVLIVGGGWEVGFVASAELYDPATGTFTATGSMKTDRNGHSAILLSNGKVLIIGGKNANGNLSSAELYDPATGVFTDVGNMTWARDYHTATLLSDGKVFITGGWNGASAEIYDPATGTFTALLGDM